ncbi:uncharacterized protein LOC123294462 [Chrysoperla carnea]|uniref:uncharacterized protein LOC123294462 n=1 Tax=Chrysoperla carnea TaxID=189513 RepID=UPI001D074166|nr:uncharacterized protein LOC123294462 [Chrysoperla carnea]
MTSPLIFENSTNKFLTDNETNEILNIVTKNITKILNEYEKSHSNDLKIPEHLWELTSSSKDYITQATQYVTPDNMTQLKHTLDNLESYKQFMINKKNSQSPIIVSVTDIDNFNEFITNITKKGLQLRNEQIMTTTTEMTTVNSMEGNRPNYNNNPFESESNKDSIIQIFSTLTDNNKFNNNQSNQEINNQLKRESIDDLLLLTTTESPLRTTSTIATPPTQQTTTNEYNNKIEDFDEILLYYIASTWNNNNTSRVDSFTNESHIEAELPKPMTFMNAAQNKTVESGTFDNSTVLLAREVERLELKEIEDAAEYGLQRMHYLFDDIEPKLYKKGLWLEKDNPAHFVASFNAQQEKAKQLAKFGYASLEATTKLALQFKEPESRASSASAFEELTASLRQTSFHDQCPLRGPVQCPPASRKYRTADGTCNNLQEPRRGSALLPMQRFISPQYQDGIQSVRRSIVFNRPLPSAREISITVHTDRNIELTAITHMLMQWGQFIDHDVTQSAQSRGFNGSVPRCCLNGGQDFQPFENMHPDCLPIAVPPFDPFLSELGIRCMEFIRSAPASRFDCSLGWREQINQVTAYIDGSNIYGSSVGQADSLRTFHDGLLAYAFTNPTSTDDEAERCHHGANSFRCFQSGDGRISEQPGLTAMGIVWVRQHNLIATKLSRENRHWSDEKLYQETRKIITAMIQHITYREFLPIILGPEVMNLFGLQLLKTGYYEKYNSKVKPEIANSFAAAAYRFGHSIVQHSFIRADRNHRLLTNNVTLHEEPNNVENIWKPRSVDRILLGMCNQPSQKRDEFISVELTNRLFQTSRFSFGMDLAAINIQRGRDHGLPTYTSWRGPCGLSPVTSWFDLQKIMSLETVNKLENLYDHFDDIDLFTGGLAEKPVRGGLVGPTFACIIAQQFSNLRQGDRFWYENGNFESSFTLEQLQQIRKITLSQVICSSMPDIDTIQPFVFLTADNLRNERVSCLDPILNSFDLAPWVEETNDFTNDVPENLRNHLNMTIKNMTTLHDDINKTDLNILRENIDDENNVTKTEMTLHDTTKTDNVSDALNLLLLSRNSLFPGELYKIEEAQLALKSKRNNKHYRNFTTINYDIPIQLTTAATKRPLSKFKSNHGDGSEDWYDEFPKPSNLPYKQEKYQYSTTTHSYGLQTFQSVVPANPTKWSRYTTTTRVPPSSSNPDLDELDLYYDLKPKRPKPSDLTYLIGVVDDKTTNNIKKNDYVQPSYDDDSYEKIHHHNRPKPHHHHNRPNQYTTTVRPYTLLTTTRRYTIRPQNTYLSDNYYPLTTETVYGPTKPRPIPTQRPPLNVYNDNDYNYNRPITQRPLPPQNGYNDNDYSYNRPITQRPLPPQNGYNDDEYNYNRPITQRPLQNGYNDNNYNYNRPITQRPDNNGYYANKPDTGYNNRPSNSDGYYSTSNNRPIIVRPEDDYFSEISTENNFINVNVNRPYRPTAVRPQDDDYQPVRPTSRPIIIQNRPTNGYNGPSTNNNDFYGTSNSRPMNDNNFYGNSNNRPNRPGFIDLSNRPMTDRPHVDDEQFSFVYGQVSNPNYGRPTRPTNQYDYNNDPNFYGDRQTDDKPRPIINNNEQPVKLFYIGNVLHKVRDGDKPSETEQNRKINDKQTTFVKISSVSGHYNDKVTTKNAYLNIKNNYQKENLDDDDLEIDESLHLYEALQETLEKKELDNSNKTINNQQDKSGTTTENLKDRSNNVTKLMTYKMLLSNETTQPQTLRI